MTRDYLAPVSRHVQVGVGSVQGLLALALTGLGLLTGWVGARRHETDLLLFGAGCLVIGVGLGRLAFRLLAGRSRQSDGGFFSPTVLRIWGVILFLEPALNLLMRSWGILFAAGSIAAGTACFALARKRARRGGESPPYEPIRPR
jgi:hypothetical protein